MISNSWGLCTDDAFFEVSRSLLEFHYGLSEGWTCSDVPEHHCHADESVLLRWECPLACGCASPRSPLWLDGPVFGCPQAACRASDAHLLESHQIPCTVTDPSELRANPDWTGLWASATAVGAGSQPLGASFPFQWVRIHHRTTGRVLFWTSEKGGPCPTGALWNSVVECYPLQTNRVSIPRHALHSAMHTGRLTRSSCARCLALTAPLTSFSAVGSTSFLIQHLETFYHAFLSGLAESVALDFLAHGCDLLVDESQTCLCGHPYFLRSVCPVVCGCVEAPHQFSCHESCKNATSRL